MYGARLKIPNLSPTYELKSSRYINHTFVLCISEPRKVLPILKTDEPICPEGKLACGSGDCIEKELFCNGKPDCKDESDENACSKFKRAQ